MPAGLPKGKSLSALAKVLALALVFYAGLSYVTLPFLWRSYETRRPPAVADLRATTTAHIPGDPINILLAGTAADLDAAMAAAGWYRADPITLRTSLLLVRSIVLGRPYDTAPVSTLLFQGRPEDRAYEKPIGNDADRRHHVRFWRAVAGNDAIWYGAASEDVAVGLNHLTGQFTHHIAPDIDQERDGLLADLQKARRIGPIGWQTGIGPTILAHNGEYDRFFTDGRQAFATLVAAGP